MLAVLRTTPYLPFCTYFSIYVPVLVVDGNVRMFTVVPNSTGSILQYVRQYGTLPVQCYVPPVLRYVVPVRSLAPKNRHAYACKCHVISISLQENKSTRGLNEVRVRFRCFHIQCISKITRLRVLVHYATTALNWKSRNGGNAVQMYVDLRRDT
jgi:hypothetical protein